LHQPQYWFRKEEPDNVDDMFSPGDEMTSKDNIANEDGTLNYCKGSKGDKGVQPNGGAAFDYQGLTD